MAGVVKNKHRQPESRIPPAASPARPPYFKYLLIVATLVLSTVVVYYPSLKVPFLLDDYGKIIRNPDIKSLSNIPSRLIYPYESPPQFHRNDPSRPLTYLTLTLNYHFSELDPYGYHVLNIALHIAVVLLIFVLASLIFPMVGVSGMTLPFLSALFFAVHPVNVNVVTYVMGRAASLATIFYVAAVIMFIKALRGTKGGTLASAACFILALAANQLALTLPAVILLTDFCFFSEGNRSRVIERWKQHLVYWGILVSYLGLRLTYFGHIGDLEATVPVFGRMEYGLTEWVVLWRYIGLALLPYGLSFEHLYGPLRKLFELPILIAAVLYGALWLTLRRQVKISWQSGSVGLFGLLWFFITISPTSSVFPTTATMAENRVYLPLIGLCLVVVFAGNGVINYVISERYRIPVCFLILGAYFSLLGYLTYQRNLLYQNPVNIWTHVITQYPDHERAHKNLAIEYYKQGRFSQAVEECEKALAIDPRDFDARNNLAAFYYNLGRYSDSLAAYRAIVQERPEYAAAYSNMGLAYEKLKNFDAAINAYKNAIRLSPQLIEPMNNLANIYLAKGRLREATQLYQSALKIDPANAEIRKNYELINARKP